MIRKIIMEMNNMDSFKKYNSDIAMTYDIYDPHVSYGAKVKSKDKKMMRQISRSRLKQDLLKEYKDNDWSEDKDE